MVSAMRLTHASIRPVGRSVSFTFDGQPIEAVDGETVAAALSAAGITTLRRTASGAPRGVFCGMGACWDCVVTVDGRIGQRACLTPARDGMTVSGGFPDVLAPPEPSPEPADRDCEVLVAGGGVAGLSAAIAAAEAGAAVVLLDERQSTGGQYAKPLAPSHADAAPDRQFALGATLRDKALKAGVTIETGALVWGAFAADEIAAMVRGQSVTYRPKRLILATGAHEAPAPVPGWTLPGVMTTGGLQTLARSQRVSPGSRVLIAGNGPLNLQLACELLAGGIKPVAVLEAAGKPGVLSGTSVLRMSSTESKATGARSGRLQANCGSMWIPWRSTSASSQRPVWPGRWAPRTGSSIAAPSATWRPKRTRTAGRRSPACSLSGTGQCWAAPGWRSGAGGSREWRRRANWVWPCGPNPGRGGRCGGPRRSRTASGGCSGPSPARLTTRRSSVGARRSRRDGCAPR
jgi:hypothetical protein